MRIMLFSRRREIDLEFESWCKETKAQYWIMNFIAWLHSTRPDILNEISMAGIEMELNLWLRIKFYWYKYIRRLDIIGFFMGVPIIRSKYLEEEKE